MDEPEPDESISPELRAELERRIALADADPSRGVPWEEVRAGAEARRKRGAVFQKLLDFVNRLSDARIHYTIRHSRFDAVMVEVAVPGQRWEIDFLADGDIDVEIFKPDGGVVAAADRLDQLIQKFGEPRAAE